MSLHPGVQQPILVQFLFASLEVPQLDLNRLRAHLSERFGRAIVPPGEGQGQDAAMIVLEDLPAGEIEGQRVPTTLALLRNEAAAGGEAVRAAVQQTWDWPEVKDVAAETQSSLAVMPMLSWVWLDRITRLDLIHGALEALLAQTNPLALHWPTCQRLVATDAYRRTRAEVPDRLYPASNVRLFRITDGEPGEVLMDTIGLAPFALPDLQIRYSNLQPPQVAAQLFNLALYLFENGDVIEDGHTVEGVPAGAIWRCRRGFSAVEPDRVVIELDP